MTYEYMTDRNLTKGIQEVFYYVNDVTNNWFMWLLLIGIYIILMVGYYNIKRDIQGALAVSGLITFIVCTLFWLGGIVSTPTLVITVVVALFGFASLFFPRKEE